jgi:hypothetical protein
MASLPRGLVDDGRTEVVEPVAEDAGLLGDAAAAQVGPTLDDDAGGFAFGVGVDGVNGLHSHRPGWRAWGTAQRIAVVAGAPCR